MSTPDTDTPSTAAEQTPEPATEATSLVKTETDKVAEEKSAQTSKPESKDDCNHADMSGVTNPYHTQYSVMGFLGMLTYVILKTLHDTCGHDCINDTAFMILECFCRAGILLSIVIFAFDMVDACQKKSMAGCIELIDPEEPELLFGFSELHSDLKESKGHYIVDILLKVGTLTLTICLAYARISGLVDENDSWEQFSEWIEIFDQFTLTGALFVIGTHIVLACATGNTHFFWHLLLCNSTLEDFVDFGADVEEKGKDESLADGKSTAYHIFRSVILWAVFLTFFFCFLFEETAEPLEESPIIYVTDAICSGGIIWGWINLFEVLLELLYIKTCYNGAKASV